MTPQAAAQMWGIYRYRKWTVMVSQLWQDSFGRVLVTIVSVADDSHQTSLPESDFLSEAVFQHEIGPI